MWGGLLFVWLTLLLFSIIKRETIAILMCLCGYIGGGLGFFVGNLIQTATRQDGVNGYFRFGNFQKQGYIASWRSMECTLGASGAIGTTVGFYLGFGRSGYAEAITQNGLWQPLSASASNSIRFHAGSG